MGKSGVFIRASISIIAYMRDMAPKKRRRSVTVNFSLFSNADRDHWLLVGLQLTNTLNTLLPSQHSPARLGANRVRIASCVDHDWESRGSLAIKHGRIDLFVGENFISRSPPRRRTMPFPAARVFWGDACCRNKEGKGEISLPGNTTSKETRKKQNKRPRATIQEPSRSGTTRTRGA